MKKDLKDMTLEELWQLFPIELKPYNEHYPLMYQEQKEKLEEILTVELVDIHHIGSTAVEGLVAKPIIDILVEVDEDVEIDQLREKLTSSGWILMHKETSPLNDVYNLGYTKKGFAEKVYHLHVRCIGNHKELYFRDYLRVHPKVCQEYTVLKQGLAVKYKHHRENYTSAKTAFIKRNTEQAIKEFDNRYKHRS